MEKMLGPYPVLQFAVATITVIAVGVGTLAWLIGEKWGKKAVAEATNAATSQPAIQLYFDGPLKAIFETLNDIKGRQLIARLEIKDDFAALLSTSKHSINANLATVQAEIIERICERVDMVNDNINSMHSRIDDLMKSLARIEVSISGRTKR